MSSTSHASCPSFSASRRWARLLGRLIQSLFRFRRKALERILFFEQISLPSPKELAIGSHAIHEYDQAVRNVREAQRTFRDLGNQLLALSEREPTNLSPDAAGVMKPTDACRL